MNSSSLEELQKLQQRSAVQAEADPAGYRARLRRQLFGLQVWSFLPILLFALLLGVSVWAFYAVGAAWGSALLLLACLILFGALWGWQLAQPMPACYAVGAESAPELFRSLRRPSHPRPPGCPYPRLRAKR